ncbi:helix-turn-helix transcriptional regulator [Pseudomonas sp. PDNC002]|uniref:helix-turn-helix domain-containing protein n=1 Tax=Pseudomonas sp. PDNC002 TaxID=2811422 RepID=UPI001962497D|nr:helix-turn-helix transcriptional regulator [Pseudomonas sp. PDNC002]QRY78653.1 helix-turn-helix transcriptional regulator [Pseudomonas sp. PDNC002]
MVKKYFLFTAGERLRALRALTGLSRRAFAETVGMKEKDVENIEYGNQRMRDEDFQKVCSVYEDFSRWITYEGPIDSVQVTWKVADSAQRAAVYMVKSNPQLLPTLGLSLEEWQTRHHEVLESLDEEERRIRDDAAEE